MNDLTSAGLYLSVAIVSAGLLLLATKQTKKVSKVALSFLALALPILLAGLRYNVGIDYPEYIRIYKSIITGDLGSIQAIEVTYHLFSHLSNWIFHGPVLLFTLYSAVFIVFAFLAIKKLTPKHLPLAMFGLMTMVYPISLNVMRQMAAAAIIGYAVTFIIKTVKKADKIKFFGLVVLSGLFHLTALFALIFYPLVILIKRYRDKSGRIFIGLGVLFLVALAAPLMLSWLAGVPFINRYTHLITDGTIAFHFSPRLLIDLGLVAVVWWAFGSELKKSAAKFTIFILLAFGIVIKAAGTFTMFGAGGRLSLYTIMFLPVVLTYITEMKINQRLPKKIQQLWSKPNFSLILIIIMVTGYFAGICLFDNSGYNILPYQMMIQWSS